MSDNEIFPASGSASAPLPQSQTNPPLRILVVDHTPAICRHSAEVLIRHGYEVNTAEDGAAGWGELQARHYDLLITEHELPGVTGVRLVSKLRAARLELPVVLVVRRFPALELARDPPLRLAATLLKPVAMDALLETVKTILHKPDSPAEQIAARANANTQLLQEILDRCRPYSHWGLNE